MKVLIDTNILLDVLCSRPGLVDASSKVWKLCETHLIEGIVCSLSIVNLSYIMRKQLTPDKIRQIITSLDLIFGLVDLNPSDIKKAIMMPFRDYEDAVQSACAQRLHADYIVTRNLKDFTGSLVPVICPEDFLDIFS